MAQEKSESLKQFAETGKEEKPEVGRSTESSKDLNVYHRNASNWGIFQHHLEFMLDKGGNVSPGRDVIIDIDASGDINILDYIEHPRHNVIHHDYHDRGKENQYGYDKVLGTGKKDQSEISSNGKPPKDGESKNRGKENDASVIQEINPFGYIPKLNKDKKSKYYPEISWEGKNDDANQKPTEEGGYIYLLEKRKEANVSHLNEQSNISGGLAGKREQARNGDNDTHFPDMGLLKIANKKLISSTRVNNNSDERGYAGIGRKVNGHKVRSGGSKPRPKAEVKGTNMTGGASSHKTADSRSPTHKNSEDQVGITGWSIGASGEPFYTKKGKTSQSGDIASGSRVTKPHGKGKGSILTGISGSQMPGRDIVKQRGKGASDVKIMHRKLNSAGEAGLGFTKVHQEEPEKINRNAQEHKLGDLEVQDKGRHGILFPDASGDIIKQNPGYGKVTGNVAGLKKDNLDVSIRKAGNSNQKSIGSKSALSVPRGSYDDRKRVLNIPTDDGLSRQGHSLYTLKSDGELIKPSQKSSKVGGTYGGNTAKQYQGHLGNLWRKKSRHEKKSQSRKIIRASDSSQSSESQENSTHDSHQSYEDYQNDQPDSYQSADSIEKDSSARSNQSEDQETRSQENSWEYKNN